MLVQAGEDQHSLLVKVPMVALRTTLSIMEAQPSAESGRWKKYIADKVSIHDRMNRKNKVTFQSQKVHLMKRLVSCQVSYIIFL